jgi:serine/threonine protein kinase/predicted ATPase
MASSATSVREPFWAARPRSPHFLVDPDAAGSLRPNAYHGPVASTSCPAEDTLAAFVAGALTQSEIARLEVHVDVCDTCFRVAAAVVAVLDSGDAEAREPVEPKATVRRLADRFEIGPHVARGGMGDVYRGIDVETGQQVAIKRLKREFTGNAEVLARFAREGDILRRLDHPNIVKMLALVAEGSKQYIVMEFVQGGSLRDLLRTQQRLAFDRALSIALEVSDALSRAHHLGVIHRDIKPENILLTEAGTVRLTDFGLAKLDDQPLTETGRLLGTVSYASPESLSGQGVDERTDLWAVGVLLFELLTGERPFVGETPGAVVRSILDDPAPDLAARCAALPPAVSALCARLLEKDPTHRHRSARQLGAALEVLLEALAPNKNGQTLVVCASLKGTPRSPGGSRAGELPLESIPFLGRESELAELERLLHQPMCRLVTILGPGGMGKSRLATEYARRVSGVRAEASTAGDRSLFEFGVFFVDLAPLSSSDLVVSAVAEAIGLKFHTQAPPERQILAYLRVRSLLLLLDNVEHVRGCALFVSDLLQGAPGLRILATSRERMGIRAETCFPLAGMEVPSGVDTAGARASSAVALFLHGARRAGAGRVDGEQVDQVNHICRLVQGVPLAVLLAAGWTATLRLGEIVDEIQRSFEFLQSTLTDIPDRQRSLRAVFEHSWKLLQEADRATFARLSVFRGSFTRGAAEGVAGAGLQTLAILIDKSLLQRETESGRYRVHELLREFAELRLRESIPALDDALGRHATYYAEFLAARCDRIPGVHQRQALADIEAELGNVRAAWRYLLATRDQRQLVRIVDVLAAFYRSRGLLAEAELEFGRLAATFAPCNAASPCEQRALVGLASSLQGWFCEEQGRSREAHRILARALDILDARENRRERALALVTTAWVEATQHSPGRGDGADHMRRLAEEGLSLYRSSNDRWGLAQALVWMGRVYNDLLGDYARAEQSCLESIAVQNAIGDGEIVLPFSLLGLGYVRIMQGHGAEGCELAERGLRAARRSDDVLGEEAGLRLLALAHRGLGNYADAESAIRQGLSLAQSFGGARSEAWCRINLGDILKEQGRLDEASLNYEATLELSDDPLRRATAQLNLGDIGILGAHRAEARRHLESSLRTFEEVQAGWGILLASDYLGYLECLEGDFPRAARHFLRALEVGIAGRMWHLVVNVAAGAALLQARAGSPARAVQLLAWAERHPSVEHQTRTRRITPLWAELRAMLSSTELDHLTESGIHLQLEDLPRLVEPRNSADGESGARA